MIAIRYRIIVSRVKNNRQRPDMHIVHTHQGNPLRLDKALVAKVPDFSREEIKEAIQNGYVQVNKQKIRKPSTIIQPGDELCLDLISFKKSFFSHPGNSPQGEDLSPYVRILEVKEHFIVCYKPAGLLVHRTNNPYDISLVEILKDMYPEITGVGEAQSHEELSIQDRSGIVHRLDKDTSGVIVVARTSHGYKELKSQFQNRTVDKSYIAIVRGNMKRESGHITYQLARSKIDHTRRIVVSEDTSKRHYSGIPREAWTEYRVIQRGVLDTIPVTKLWVNLHTGRTHQIRLHLKAIDHPILGDKMYGGKWEKYYSPVERQLLHAYSVSFVLDGKRYTYYVEAQEDMRLDEIQKY